MKQSVVEWLYERLERMIPRTALYNIDKKEYFEQAKEMEKQKQDEFAIGFAEWLNFNFKLDFTDNAFKELLEVFKKEKGLCD